jgi:CheY-like chemotaxis protein
MTRRHGGTGLGLYLAKRLANLLGGDVALVSSGVGSGSTFRITVPCTVLEGPPVAPRPEADGLAAPEALRPLSGLRVLLVEDVADNRHLVSRFLILAGASVDTADDGLDGLNKALAGAYDVVLMDMQMPRLDGVEATRRLRQNGYGGAVIALTAHARQEDQARCLAAGCDDFLSKPVHRAELIDKLAALARRQPPASGHKPETH